MPSKIPKVFISYAHQDREVVEGYIRALAARNVKYWTDIELRAGDDWMKQIENALDQASVFILFISPDFLASQWGMIEVGLTLSRVREFGAILVPVLLRESNIPGPINRFNYIDARFTKPADFAEQVGNILEKARMPNPGATPDG